MYTALYLDQILVDIIEAKIWYKEQNSGLEIKFAVAIENAINKILVMPTMYAPRYKNIRIAHPITFPYNIHFYINEVEKEVIFTAVVHNKRGLEFID